MKHAINWFEIPVTHLAASKAFYETVFKCELQVMQVGPESLALFPATELSGALIEQADYVAHPGVVVYLNIPDSIDLVLERAVRAGGRLVAPRTLIDKNVGWSASFTDLDGTLIGLYESV